MRSNGRVRVVTAIALDSYEFPVTAASRKAIST